MDWGEFFRVLGEGLTPVATTLIVGIIGAGVAVGLSYLKRWTGVQVTDTQRFMFDMLTRDAINFAEEQALKAMKARDKTPDSDTKMEAAVKYALGHARDMGLPGMARDRLVELIEANLMAMRPPEEFAVSKSHMPESTGDQIDAAKGFINSRGDK